MSQQNRRFQPASFRSVLMFVTFLIMPGVAVAQSTTSLQRDSSPPNALKSSTSMDAAAERPASNLEDRLKVLEDDLRRQSKALAEMQATIAEQQHLIETLTAKATGSDQRVTEQKAVASVSAVSDQSPSTSQTPSLEDRVKKVEGRMLAIGGLRFSGDFRLRFDGIFRKADPTPPAGFAALTHQQNARMRYRVRLNLDTDIDSRLSFHGQLSTGQVNNPLTGDQDFGETTAHHPFFISEAWIDFHPNKATQFQAGRVQEIFADNSRFLFDDDIRFNGFNEKYNLTFKRNSLKISSLEFRAGQYIFSNPNVAIVTAGSPLAQAGALLGSTGRSSNLFHQGVLMNQKFNDRWSSQFGGEVPLYCHPNQIQLASTPNWVALIF